MKYEAIFRVDPEIAKAIFDETKRLQDHLELIASENFVSEAVLEAAGSVFTNKYAEGYPGRRYYGGCEYADVVETLARDRLKALFNAEHANVQPHCGTQANMAVYMTVLKPGDTMLGMNLSHGGHLSHGHPLNFTGKLYKVVPYGVKKDTETIDYDEIESLCREHKPKLIVVGASAYPRTIDYKTIYDIAKKYGALVMADIAHIAGLIVAGLHPSPTAYADFVTSTTHKTLRGPRGGIIMCKSEFAKELDKNVFPGVQGGPLVHIIAAKAVSFKEAMEPSFREYQKKIVENAKHFANIMMQSGWRLVSGGTDTHLFLVDVFASGITGKDAENKLNALGITVNKNTIPFDKNPPLVASGIRIGTPAVTTRGMGCKEMEIIASLITRVLKGNESESIIKEVKMLCDRFPLYPELMKMDNI